MSEEVTRLVVMVTHWELLTSASLPVSIAMIRPVSIDRALREAHSLVPTVRAAAS